MHLRFRCAHIPARNGIVECCHRSTKTIAARKNYPTLEAVYWYNVTSKDNLSSTLPADVLHRYHNRVRDIDAMSPPEPQITGGRYKKGDIVWVKTPHSRCMTKFGTGHVTEVISQQSVWVNGTPCHVKDLCPFQGSHPLDDEGDTEDSERPIYLGLGSASDPSNIGGSPTNTDMLSSPEEEEILTIPLRGSTGNKKGRS